MRESVSELLSRIDGIQDSSTRVDELKKAANGRLQELLQLGLHPNIKFDLPAGTPPYTADPGVYTHGIFWQEIRRLPIFLENGKLAHLPLRREHMFIEMLESVHPDDAKLICAIKDRQWPFENITSEIVEQAFPGLIGA